MARGRRPLFAVAIVALVAGWVPGAQAKPTTVGSCITRETATHASRESRSRDFVEAPNRDELTAWIKANGRAAAAAAARSSSGGPVTIPVWVHVIRKDLTVAGGNLPRSRIDAQIKVLTDSFSGKTGGTRVGFRFELAGVTRSTKSGWFHLTGWGQETAMKTALKVGGPETLNIYTASLGAQLLGWAYLAQDAEEVGVLDGVVVHYQSLPGGAFSIYSEGDTATHEVGHWLDLFHTFEGGCEGPGDFVNDTAPEASPAFRCPIGRDTCPGGGADPITNFMDYTQDNCMFEFTSGQAARMRQAWTAFRV